MVHLWFSLLDQAKSTTKMIYCWNMTSQIMFTARLVLEIGKKN